MMKKKLSNIFIYLLKVNFLSHFGIYSIYSLYKLSPCKTFKRENKIHRVKVTSDPDPYSLEPDPYQNETDPK